jgi:hypothetical protein
MHRRLISTSLILIVIGLLPFFLSLFRIELEWPTRLPDIPFIPIPIRQWFVAYGSFRLIAIVGIALLVLAGILVVRSLWVERLRTKLISTSDVLLDEAREIHGEQPDTRLLEDIRNFYLNGERWPQEQSERIEGEEVSERDVVSNVSPAVFRWLNGMHRTALCLSGGGIRSASFALGVLQALAMHPRPRGGQETALNPEKSLLAQFNYLSTVSGGGYIGGWLSAWVQRAGFASVWKDLVHRRGGEQDPGEQPAPVKWIRAHSNYLTPKLGLSGDTLADVAIILRNLLLNWLVLLPMLCAVLILMKLMVLKVFGLWGGNDWKTLWQLPFGLWLVLLITALSFTLRHRPTYTSERGRQANEAAFLAWGLVPSILAAVAFTVVLAAGIFWLKEPCEPHCDSKWYRFLHDPTAMDFVAAALLGGAIYGLSYAISWIRSWPTAWATAWTRIRALASRDRQRNSEQTATGSFWRWMLSGALYGVLVLVIGYWFINNDEPIEKWLFLDIFNLDPSTSHSIAQPRRLLAVLYLGVPLMLGAQLVAEMVFVGLTSTQYNSDEDREWTGRAAGLSLLAGLGWLVIMHLAYISTDITFRAGAFFLKHRLEFLVAISLLFVVGIVAAAIVRRTRTSARQDDQREVQAKKANATLSVVAAVLVVVLVVGVSAMIDYCVLGQPIADIAQYEDAIASAQIRLLLAFVTVLFVALISSANININRFSMHALYRNRVIRTFLGASNKDRRPNPFTDFARDDNPCMDTLWPGPRQAKAGEEKTPAGARSWHPFHIVNIALNVTSSERHLEWQERKAASFTVSPLHSGSAITGFRSSTCYGRRITLGTAMAVSGAAASPNQGYNSSPAIAFLMALFNVRLGWWLGNPGRVGEVTHKFDGPRNALVPFLAEMLGMTSDANKYVYLSDGGHFENLGLYEVVRRRCRFIVVVDAGCDPEFAFEDLGNAVRKIEIDLGVPIRFHGLDKLKSRHSAYKLGEATAFLHDLQGAVREPKSGRTNDLQTSPYHAIGKVDYPAADGQQAKSGIILYIKPAYHGTESSAGIRSYALSNPSFPHDDTANQWFGESQMESYRALGFAIMDEVLRKAQDLKGNPDLSLLDVLDVLSGSGDGPDHGA